MKIYGLTAGGMLWLDRRIGHIPCIKMFRTREEAEREIPSFIARVCQPADDDLDCFIPETVSVVVHEYELQLTADEVSAAHDEEAES